jgi:Leucine-rich repeat (LRR) protein
MALQYESPNESFLSELRQLSRDAVQARKTLEQSNRLPEDFPREAVVDLCLALEKLKDGTAQNAGVQLEIARAMLPRIRREHFAEDVNSSEPNSDDARLYRGMLLDQHIGLLILAITTSLDEYRHQIQATHEDKVRVETELELDDSPLYRAANRSSAQVITQTEKLSTQIQNSGFDQNKYMDRLKRRIVDGGNLAHLAQSQLQLRPIVQRWYDSTVNAIMQTPDLIEKAGRMIVVGVDVSKPLVDWFVETIKDEIDSYIKYVASFGIALQQAGKRLQEHSPQKRGRAERQRDPEVVAAELKVAEMLKNGLTPPVKLASLVEILNLSGRFENRVIIHRPGDLALLNNLRHLTIQSLDPSVSALAKYPGLKDIFVRLSTLGVDLNQSEDVGAVSALTGLTSLSVNANQVSDISALGKLTGLTSLSVYANQFSDISALGKLTGLTSLSVQSNQFSDISALGKLTGLTSLSVQSNQFSDISALGKLTGLTSLSVNANQVSDISALGKLTGLTSLSVQANQVSDISALGKLTGLTSLSVHANQVSDISALGKLTGLTSLTVQSNQVSDISALEKLKTLEFVVLRQLKGRVDLRPLEELSSLKKIRLSDVATSHSGKIQHLVEQATT